MKHFNELPEFQKEFKRLLKKYRTLDEDLEKFKKVVAIHPLGIGKNFIIIRVESSVKIIKAHLACRALRNNHLLRIIYAYREAEAAVDFIELYFKGEQVNENRELIKEFLKRLAI